MKLKVVATGSAANCYVLYSDTGESLILDAGVPVRQVLQAIPDFRKVSGCLVTHEHNDHARAWQDYSMRGIPVVMSAGTYDALNKSKAVVDYFTPTLVKPMKRLRLGNYIVMPFQTQHDATEPFGFLVKFLPTDETVLYATDTYYLRYTFPGVNYWIVECNYCEELINEETDAVLRNRLKESHMSLRRLKDALAANDLTESSKIVLVHLSDSRSNERQMVDEITEQTGLEVVAAAAGMKINLNLTPF